MVRRWGSSVAGAGSSPTSAGANRAADRRLGEVARSLGRLRQQLMGDIGRVREPGTDARPPSAKGAGDHARSDSSTTTGAWSEGFWPFRASRSIETAPDRADSARLNSTRSIRIPLPWWKSPAR